MDHTTRTSLTSPLATLATVLAFAWASASFADERRPAAASPAADADEASPMVPTDRPQLGLVEAQSKVQRDFVELEELLLKLAKASATTDPGRAAMLRQAVEQSKKRRIALQLADVADLIQDDRLAKAIADQKNVLDDLRSLLDLLQSEDRAKHIEDEKQAVRKFLQSLNRIIKQQEGIFGRSEGGDDAKQLAEAQGRIADQTKELHRDIKDRAAPPDGDAPNKTTDKTPPDKEPPDKNPPDGKSGEKVGGDEDAPSDDQEANPARPRLEAAERKMRAAQEKLKRAQRQGALDDQRAALEELQQAKAELERILRQLREEEMHRVLAMLEGRFRDMLEIQIQVHDGTKRLDETAADKRDREFSVQSGRLARQEQQIVLACARALALLREEGTAVALPEAVEQVHADMRQIATLLEKARVDRFTQGVEEDVIVALEEIIAALNKAQEKLDDKKPPPGQQPGPAEPIEPPLVDMLAELKMVRTLQVRVNNRTKANSALIDGEQAKDPDVLRSLEQLSERQRRIVEITRDIHTGKNQ